MPECKYCSDILASSMSENDNKQTNPSWGGRFSEQTDAFVEAFTASVQFDQRIYKQDITGSKAHARMLHRVGVLSAADCEAILNGLDRIIEEIEAGEFAWSVTREDVHMNIEARLTELIGDAGKRLHTGRSRNDQVATDIRLYLREQITDIIAQLVDLQKGLLDLAEAEANTIMPGFTHLQVAQPVTFGHHMMAWFEMLQRDATRMSDCVVRMNVSPLGAAALAGTSYPIDRDFTATELGFSAPAANSLDAVSDRDFALEFCAVAAILGPLRSSISSSCLTAIVPVRLSCHRKRIRTCRNWCVVKRAVSMVI